MGRAAAATRTSEGKNERGSTRGREVGGIVLLGCALFLALSLGSLQLGKGTLMGPVGRSAGLGLYMVLGVGGWLLVWGLAALAVRCLTGGALRPRGATTAAVLVGGVGLVMLLHLALAAHRLHGHAPGGLLGEYGAELLGSLIGRIGAAIVAATAILSAVVLMTSISLRGATELAVAGLRAAGRFGWESVRAIFPERGEESDEDADDEDDTDEDDDEDDEEAAAKPVIVGKPDRRVHDAAAAKKKRRDDTQGDDEHDLDADAPEPGAPAPAEPIIVGAKKKAEPKKKRGDEARRVELEALASAMEGSEERAGAEVVDAETAIELIDKKPTPAIAPMIVAKPTPKKVDAKAAVKDAPAPQKGVTFIPAKGGYHLPSLELLDYEESAEDGIDKASMLSLAERLQKTLGDYGVRGQVVQIHPGPVVTMYEFVPVAGTKLSKITGLSNDLAMSLEAMSVRIVAPIPGKGSVGIEVPNKKRAKVFLKEILLDEGVNKAKSKLTLGLGKDISGAPVAVDLARMPHLLVAGTTGSGKSVSVNGMICSMLFNATPDEVRLIMIDPKMVELSIYEGIPHLLLPVVTDPKKANLALKWAVDEMERRYELVSKAGVRDLVTYNKKVEKLLAEPPPKLEEPEMPDGEVAEEIADEISAKRAAAQAAREAAAATPPPTKLPYIVVIIDEFADLMMVAPKDVETSVARIAQKARAVGIHLILATQRPSVDVITGLIKANFPSRIAFQVASKIDARTVLDQQGAESLLGQGDSLFSDRGAALRRVHGALVTEEEIKKMVDFLKTQGQPVYDMDILKPRGDEDEDGELNLEGDGEKDEMYDQAVRLVCETRMASVSMIQRRLQVGFNRAARMVEQMERDGIVGAANGSKPREVIAQAI